MFELSESYRKKQEAQAKDKPLPPDLFMMGAPPSKSPDTLEELEKMYGIEYTEKTNPRTSFGRFYLRQDEYRSQNRAILEHHFWWFVHNAIAHPGIAIAPLLGSTVSRQAFKFHDYTSDKINAKI